MTTLHFPSGRSLTDEARLLSETKLGRRLASLGAYLLATVAAMAVGPLLFMLGERGAMLSWSNLFVDFVE
jgi:hypothetical protein